MAHRDPAVRRLPNWADGDWPRNYAPSTVTAADYDPFPPVRSDPAATICAAPSTSDVLIYPTAVLAADALATAPPTPPAAPTACMLSHAPPAPAPLPPDHEMGAPTVTPDTTYLRDFPPVPDWVVGTPRVSPLVQPALPVVVAAAARSS